MDLDQRKLSRRTLTRGTVWAAPVLISTATIPAYAASKNSNTSVVGAAYLYSNIKTVISSSCSTTSNPQPIYVSTLGTENDPDADPGLGLWFESSKGGTVSIKSAVVQYIFNHKVEVVSSPP